MITIMRMRTMTNMGTIIMLDDFLFRALLAGVGVALATGPLGAFVVWRRMAYFGDSTAHAAILGVALALALDLPIGLGTLVVSLGVAVAVATLAARGWAMDTTLGVLAHSALALGLVRTATFMRYTRNSVLEVMNNDYVRTARAKGLGEWLVVTRHILRNALVPVVTVIGLTLPVLFGGSVVIEMIFQWPGIGLMFISAVTGRDSPVIMGYVLFSAVMVQVCNLLTDLAYSFLDPRIRYD